MTAIRRLSGRVIGVAVVAALVAVLVVWRLGGGGGYTVSIIFPAATNLQTGALVEVQGFTVGNVKHLGVNNGQAEVQVTINSANAPLHVGTTAAILYRSLLGERYVELVPGPKTSPVISSGHIISNQVGNGEVTPRVEISDLLNKLDPQTRSQLADLMPQVQQIFAGQNINNTQATLQTAEPAVRALAQVLDAVGADGQTLHQLVSDMAGLSTRLVSRQNSLVSTVSGLDQSMSAVATQTNSLSAGINELPATLTQAQTTLGLVPQTTKSVLPLLGDLRVATSNLPSFASKLDPVLTELQPVSAELIPTLNGLNTLLQYTPALANTINSTVPRVTNAATQLEPDVNFLRPYSPELAGFMTNWGNWLSSYNATGHLVPVPPTSGASSFNAGLPSGLNLSGALSTPDANRAPGALSGTPITDAAGNAAQ